MVISSFAETIRADIAFSASEEEPAKSFLEEQAVARRSTITIPTENTTKLFFLIITSPSPLTNRIKRVV